MSDLNKVVDLQKILKNFTGVGTSSEGSKAGDQESTKKNEEFDIHKITQLLSLFNNLK